MQLLFSQHAYYCCPIVTRHHLVQMHHQYNFCFLISELLLQLKTPTKHQEKFSGQQRWAVPGQKMKVGGVLAGVHLMQIPRGR